MTPYDLEALFGLFDSTTDEGTDVCACSRRVTSSACPGRNEP